MRCKVGKQLQCRTIDSTPQCSHRLITASNSAKYMFTPTIQLGTDKSSDKSDKEKEKKKGDDYVNNIQKLFEKLGIANISQIVKNLLDLISSLRPTLTATGVKGEDYNQTNYSLWAKKFTNEIIELKSCITTHRPKYYLAEIMSSIRKITQLLQDMPDTIKDKRVLDRLKKDIDNIEKMDDAVLKLSKETIEIFQGLPKHIGSNNCLINAIANAAGIVPNIEQYIRIRQNLSVRYSLHEMLDFDPFVLGIITQEFGLNNHIIVVNSQRAYFNNNVYIGENEVNRLIHEANSQSPILYITHNYLHFAALNGSV